MNMTAAGLLCAALAVAAISSTNAIQIGLVEFDPTVTNDINATQVLEDNTNELRKELSSVQNRLDVIVLPEYALTGLTGDYKGYAIHVPKIEAEKPDYQSIILRLSNIASEFGKYVIVPLLENSTNHCLYSTAVVFDRTGQIISKHRKLSLKPTERGVLCAGQESTVVQIENQKYALMFAEELFTTAVPNNTDSIIVLSSLENTVPYGAVLSLYSAYALKNQKNVLVAGLSHPYTGRSGTGSFIYNSANSSLISKSYISGKRSTSEIITDVVAKSIAVPQTTPVLRGLPTEDTLATLMYKNSSGYKLIQKLQVENNKQVTHSAYNCFLSDINPNVELTSYKFVQLSGEWKIGNATYQTSFCGIAVHPNQSDALLGQRFRTGVTFATAAIQLNLLQNSSIVYPLSLDTNLQPVGQLSFRRNGTAYDIVARDAQDVNLLGYLVLTKSGAFTFAPSVLLVLLVTLAVARFA